MLSKDIHIDEQLISRVKNGDEQAFREIFYQFHKPMYSIALKYLRDYQQAEDAIQDVFLKLWMNRYRIEKDSSLKGFLFTMLKNHLLNVIRNRKTEMVKKADIGQHRTCILNDTESNMLMDEYQEHISKGINQLSPQRQNIFKMRVYMGHTNEEISNKLNISKNTVKFQLSQATKFLKNYLKKDL